MKYRLFYTMLFFCCFTNAQILITSAEALAMSNASEGDMYLNTENNTLYMGLSDGSLRTLDSGVAGDLGISGVTDGDILTWDTTTGNWITTPLSLEGWGVNGNINVPTTAFLGTLEDVDMNIVSNNTTILQLGRRQTLGLVQGFVDYDDPNQHLLQLRGNNGTSALQFEAANATFYKPIFFTTPEGNFRLKGSSAGTDFFELGSQGTANNGSFDLTIGDDGNEPIVLRKFNYNPPAFVEMMRLQGTGLNDNVRVGIKTAGVMANSTLQIGGSLSLPIRALNGTTTLTENDYSIILNPRTYANPGVLLPAATTCLGRVYLLKNISGVVVNFNTPFIYTNGISYTGLPTNYTITIQSDGTNWHVISTNY